MELLTNIVQHYEALLSLAENGEWEVFQQQLVQRDALLQELNENMDKLTPSESNNQTIKKLAKLNKEVLALASAHQHKLQTGLSILQKGHKATQAYGKDS